MLGCWEGEGERHPRRAGEKVRGMLVLIYTADSRHRDGCCYSSFVDVCTFFIRYCVSSV